MTTKRIMRWGTVLFLLAALPVMTAVMAQGQEPAVEQLPVVTEPGESAVAFPWTNTETEPNNNTGAADDWCPEAPFPQIASCNQVHGGIISTTSDVDYWDLYVANWPFEDGDGYSYWTEYYYRRDNYPVLIDIEAQSMGSPLNATVCLYSDDGYEVGCNNDTDTLDPMLYFNFEVTNSDTPRHYYLAVRAHNGIGAGTNGKYQLLVSTPYLFSAAAKGLTGATVEGIPIQSGDILAFSQYQPGYKWVMLFDLSDLGVKGNVTNLTSGWRNSDYLMLGFAANVTLPGIGRPVTPWEVVLFNPTQIGPNTQGTFQLWWDGRNHGLTLAAEKLDAIDWPNWNGVTRLSVSTIGAAKVYGGPTANVLRLPDEDIGLWSDGPAAQNYPRWSRFFDTSVANASIVDVIAYSFTEYQYHHEIWHDDFPSEVDDVYSGWYMVVQGVPGFSQKDVIDNEYVDGWTSNIFWHGPDYGWNYNLDAMQVQESTMRK